jgi:protein phosphatase
MQTAIDLPAPCLVVLVGASSSGKSTFAARHFLPGEVLSSDAARTLVADDEHDMGANDDAFELLRFLAAKRLARRRVAVVDATNVDMASRLPFVALARAARVPAVAIVLDLPGSLLEAWHRRRGDRPFGPSVIRRQRASVRRGLGSIEAEGFDRVWVLHSVAELDSVVLTRIAHPPTAPSGGS